MIKIESQVVSLLASTFPHVHPCSLPAERHHCLSPLETEGVGSVDCRLACG